MSLTNEHGDAKASDEFEVVTFCDKMFELFSQQPAFWQNFDTLRLFSKFIKCSEIISL